MTPENPSLVDAVVAAFRAEGMKGDDELVERFARVAVETCVCPDCGGTGTRRVHSHEDYGVSFESETCESCPLGQAMLHAETLEVAVETCERDTVRLRAAVDEALGLIQTASSRSRILKARDVLAAALAEIGERDG